MTDRPSITFSEDDDDDEAGDISPEHGAEMLESLLEILAYARAQNRAVTTPQTAHLINLAALVRDGDPDGAINATDMTDEAFVALMRSRYRP